MPTQVFPHESISTTNGAYPDDRTLLMPVCADGRYHRTAAEAGACLHHPSDKDFSTVNPDHPNCAKVPRRPAPQQDITYEDEDEEGSDNELPVVPPITPAPAFDARSTSKSPSPLGKRAGLPTPPFSQEVEEEEDIGDNIVVGMSSSPPAMPAPNPVMRLSPPPRSSPLVCDSQKASPARQASPVAKNIVNNDDYGSNALINNSSNDDDESVHGPLSTTPTPPAAARHHHDHLAAAAAPRTHITETSPPASPTHFAQAGPTLADLENQILHLRADRTRLTDALSNSTFRAQNLVTRSQIQLIELRLARREATAAKLRERAMWGLVELAREGRRNAWISAGMVVAMGLVYVCWCWCMTVESAYVRRRRGEVLFGRGEL